MEDGSTRIYDYQADEVGSGGNCYLVYDLDPVIYSVKAQKNGDYYDIVILGDEIWNVIERLYSVSEDANFLTVYDHSDFYEPRSDGSYAIKADISTPELTATSIEGLQESDLNLCVDLASSKR